MNSGVRWIVWGFACLAAAVTASGHAAPSRVPDGEWWHALRHPAGETCQGHFETVHRSAAEAAGVLDQEFAHYQRLVEKALAYRAETIDFGLRLKERIGESEPLTGADLHRLNEGMLAHLELRDELYGLAEAHECWVALPEAEFRRKGMTSLQRLQGVMISLSAALVLYDNYLLAVSIYEEDPKLRRVLNSSDSGYGIGREVLSRITLSYNSIQNRARVRAGIAFYEREIRNVPASALEDGALRYLRELILQSPSYNMTKTFAPAYVVGRKLKFMEGVTVDQLAQLANNGVSLFSMLFGNAVGLVETRKGKLHGRDDVRAEVADRLRAGDILLEKTPFRLTDTLIPGYWGHAAIWIGTEQELRALGLWDHPVVVPYRDRIRAGRLVVEALRSGVQMNPLERFLNIDDMAALRARNLDDQGRAEIIIRTLRQVGKAYDFNFDVETTDRIVCSELVYLAYADVRWPTAATLGRATISPDQIAAKALQDGPLDVVLLYADGVLVQDRPRERLAGLLAGDTKMAGY